MGLALNRRAVGSQTHIRNLLESAARLNRFFELEGDMIFGLVCLSRLRRVRPINGVSGVFI